MKYIVIAALSTFLWACNNSETSEVKSSHEHATQPSSVVDTAATTTLEWLDPEVQDLGTITKGQVVEVSWRFKNTGNKPLLINDAHAGCGCTVPEPPKEPIAPGEEGVIRAKFNSAGFNGHVTKDVFVEANNSNRNNETNNKLSLTADIKE